MVNLQLLAKRVSAVRAILRSVVQPRHCFMWTPTPRRMGIEAMHSCGTRSDFKCSLQPCWCGESL